MKDSRDLTLSSIYCGFINSFNIIFLKGRKVNKYIQSWWLLNWYMRAICFYFITFTKLYIDPNPSRIKVFLKRKIEEKENEEECKDF